MGGGGASQLRVHCGQEGMFLVTPCMPGTLPPGAVGDNGLFVAEVVRHLAVRGPPLGLVPVHGFPPYTHARACVCSRARTHTRVCLHTPACVETQNPRLDLRGLLRRIQRGVSDETAGAQVPFVSFYTLSPDPLFLLPSVALLYDGSDAPTAASMPSLRDVSTHTLSSAGDGLWDPSHSSLGPE